MNFKIKPLLSPIYNRIVKMLNTTVLTKSKGIMKLNTFIRAYLKPDFIITKEGHKLFLDENDSLHLSIYIIIGIEKN